MQVMQATTDIAGWRLDLRAVYGSLWEQRARFHLREWLAEAPGGVVAVLFYGLGEIGVNKQVGRLAVLRNKAQPVTVLRPEKLTFWFEGMVEDPVRFDEHKQLAFVSEYVDSWESVLQALRGLPKKLG